MGKNNNNIVRLNILFLSQIKAQINEIPIVQINIIKTSLIGQKSKHQPQ